MLSERTVGRKELLELLQRRLLTAATSKNRPHTLLIGPRGAGKTHVVDVAIYRATEREDIASRLAFVRLDEDAIGITRYADILAEVVRRLSGPQAFRQRATPSSRPEADVAQALGDRVLVLVIENLHRIFASLGEAGQQDLRSWVENSGQVMILATSPLLFPGVGDRAMPWYGNFGISHLEDLDPDESRQLLIHLARQSDDAMLAEFIASDRGEARLRAINALAGGSPRIWMILSEGVTVERLDELVPAVEALLEGLVPYYQQLLWDLSGNEQRLVRELAEGTHQAATVAELAAACGLEQRTAATTLGRLAELRWVRSEKAPELDQRSSWYRLREPMFRHHLQYRASAGQPLILIVELLRAWFDPSLRRGHLAIAAPASETEPLMPATPGPERVELDSASADRDADREVDRDVDRDVDTLLVEEADRIGDLLRLAAASTSDHTPAVIELISACWEGEREPSTARDRLRAVEALLAADRDDVLRRNVQAEVAYWTGEAGDAAAACDLAFNLLTVLASQPRHEEEVSRTARLILQKNATRLLTTQQARREPGPADVADLGLAATLRAAVDGSAEALVRLPSELVEIVTALQTV